MHTVTAARDRSGTRIAVVHAALALLFAGAFAWRALAAHQLGWTGARLEWERTWSVGLTHDRREEPRPARPDVASVARSRGPFLAVRDGSPAAVAGLAWGDELRALRSADGGPLARGGIALYEVLRRAEPPLQRPRRRWSLLGLGGEGTTWLVREPARPGARDAMLRVAVPLRSPWSDSWLAGGLVASAVEALLCLLIGALVWSRRPHDERARVLALTTGFVAAVIAGDTLVRLAPFATVGRPPAPATTLLQALELAPWFLPAFLLHLSLVFPVHRPEVPRRAMPLLYAPPLALGAAALALDWLARTEWFAGATTPVVLAVVLPLAVVVAVPILGLLLAYPAATCLSLVLSYRQGTLEERRRIRWPAWSLLVLVVGSTAVVFADVLGFVLARRWLLPEALVEEIRRALLLLIPLGFAVGIGKHHLLGIDRLLRRTTVYGALTLTVLGGYLLLAATLGGFVIDRLALEGSAVVVLSTLAVAAALVPLRNSLQSVVEHRLFPQRQRYPLLAAHLRERATRANAEQPLLAEVVAELRAAIGCRWTGAWTPAGGGEWRLVAAAGLGDEGQRRLATLVARLPSGPPQPIAALGDGPQGDALRATGAELVVPAGLGGAPMVLLVFGGRGDGERWTAEDLGLLETVGLPLAGALLHLRQSERNEEYEQTRAIQEGLLPRAAPRRPGYEVVGTWVPAREVGGDYYDYLELPDGRLAVCIGDIAGKGLPAALLMSNLQAAVRAVAATGASPAELCARVDRLLRSNLAGGRFASFFAAFVDTRSGRVLYANAGHPPPLLARADGRVEELAAGGPVLGAFRQATYREAETQLAAGDRLLLYTDGVTEARDRDDEELGEAGLRRLLAEAWEGGAEELQRAIVGGVFAHASGTLQDDLTLVVIVASAQQGR